MSVERACTSGVLLASIIVLFMLDRIYRNLQCGAEFFLFVRQRRRKGRANSAGEAE